MPPRDLWISIGDSRLGRSAWFFCLLTGSGVLLVHPFKPLLLLLPLLGFYLLCYWRLYFGRLAPQALHLQQHQGWMIDRQGELHEVQLRPRWNSYLWSSLYLPRHPPGFRVWLVWPDSVSREARRQLRVWLKNRKPD